MRQRTCSGQVDGRYWHPRANAPVHAGWWQNALQSPVAVAHTLPQATCQSHITSLATSHHLPRLAPNNRHVRRHGAAGQPAAAAAPQPLPRHTGGLPRCRCCCQGAAAAAAAASAAASCRCCHVGPLLTPRHTAIHDKLELTARCCFFYAGMLEIARKKGLARNLANMRQGMGCGYSVVVQCLRSCPTTSPMHPQVCHAAASSCAAACPAAPRRAMFPQHYDFSPRTFLLPEMVEAFAAELAGGLMAHAAGYHTGAMAQPPSVAGVRNKSPGWAMPACAAGLRVPGCCPERSQSYPRVCSPAGNKGKGRQTFIIKLDNGSQVGGCGQACMAGCLRTAGACLAACETSPEHVAACFACYNTLHECKLPRCHCLPTGPRHQAGANACAGSGGAAHL